MSHHKVNYKEQNVIKCTVVDKNNDTGTSQLESLRPACLWRTLRTRNTGLSFCCSQTGNSELCLSKNKMLRRVGFYILLPIQQSIVKIVLYFATSFDTKRSSSGVGSIYSLTTLFRYFRLYSVEWKNDRRMMNWKGCGRKRSWPNCKVLSRHSPGETAENLSQNSRSPGRDFNPGRPEYDV
jgi:hypothetical protein